MDMWHRTRSSALLVAGLVAAVGGVAHAQPRGTSKPAAKVAGTYDAKFEQVANNCSGVGMNLATSSVDLSQSAPKRVSVTIPSVPIMGGSVNKAGKFKAAVKRGKTAIQGVDGRFSIAGKVDKEGVQFLFIAEYFTGPKPLCTQSWNGKGPRK